MGRGVRMLARARRPWHDAAVLLSVTVDNCDWGAIEGASPARARPLLVTNDFPPQVGGIERFTLELARHLPGAAVLAASHPDARAHDRAERFPIYRAPSSFMLPTSRTRGVIEDAIADHGASIVVFVSPLPLSILGTEVSVPWTVIAHGAELTVPAHLPGIGGVIRGRLTEAPALFAVSQHTAGQLRELLGEGCPPVRLVRNGVPLETFRPDLDGSAVRKRLGLGDAPVLGCVGRLVPRKGQDRLIEALPLIHEEVPEARLLIVGDGRLRRRLERSSRAMPDGAIVLAGAVEPEELGRHFAAVDVFAHPNRSRWFGLEQEGFGVIFLEAQACGKPVIAGHSGGSPEAIDEGRTGLLVDGDDIGEVAGAAVALLKDPGRAAAMGAAGRRLVEREFGWPTVAGRFARDLAEATAAAS